MQRTEALKGLSREHHEALVLARRASATASDSHSADALALCSHLTARWQQQFAQHFAREEQTLFPALERAGHGQPVAVARMQHTALRELAERLRQGDVLALVLWGNGMDAHVRFEERTLFPLAQTVLEPSALTDVMKLSAAHPSSSI